MDFIQLKCEIASLARRRRRFRRLRPLWAALPAIAAAIFTATFAQAALVQHGDLFITFNGELTPAALPRHAPTPIDIRVAATIRTPDDVNPPALRQITVEINRYGRLETRGLPRCSASRIQATSTAVALAACRSALVGTGSFTANETFPEVNSFPSSGRILAFNSTVGGRPAILAHVYGTQPLSTSRNLTFRLRSSTGTYGTVLSATLPKSINDSGYLKSISLRLHRLYTYRGATHSYLSADCPAPAGFPGAVFPLAHASMSFADGVTLSSTVIRSCRVRR